MEEIKSIAGQGWVRTGLPTEIGFIPPAYRHELGLTLALVANWIRLRFELKVRAFMFHLKRCSLSFFLLYNIV